MTDFTTLKCAGSDNGPIDKVYFNALNETGEIGVTPLVTTATSGSVRTADGNISAERRVSPAGHYPHTMILENGGVTDVPNEVGNPPTSIKEKDALKKDAEKYAKACATAVGPKGP